MRIKNIIPIDNYMLQIITECGCNGLLDVKPYLSCEAFKGLKDQNEFKRVTNRGYFIEWECGADLSADTIEARLIIT